MKGFQLQILKSMFQKFFYSGKFKFAKLLFTRYFCLYKKFLKEILSTDKIYLNLNSLVEFSASEVVKPKQH